MTKHQAKLDAVREADMQSRWYVEHGPHWAEWTPFEFGIGAIQAGYGGDYSHMYPSESRAVGDFIVELVKRIEELETVVINQKRSLEKMPGYVSVEDGSWF